MSDDVSLVQLEYFRAVVRRGSLTKAAEALNVTQPTLSAAVARLEGTYGVKLLARIPRKGVEPTLAGRRLMKALEPLLDTARGLGGVARGSEEPLEGELSVGVYAPLAPIYSAALLTQAAERLPLLDIRLSEGDLESLPEALKRGQLDLAIMYDDGLDTTLGVHPLTKLHPHVVVAEDHHLARSGQHSVSLRALADEPAVLLASPHSLSRYTDFFRMVGVTPTIRHTSQNYEVIRSYVAAGLGYSILHHQHQTLETHSGRRIVPLRIEEELPAAALCLVSPEPAPLSAKAQAFKTLVSGIVGILAGPAK